MSVITTGKGFLGDNGIRVQTSNIGDITAQTAVENMTIQQAIHDGDWYAATKGTDNLNKHRLEIETIPYTGAGL